MLQSLNTSLVSMGYEPVDAITNDDYKLWYQKALENSVPVDVVDALFSTLDISSPKGLMQLTKDVSIDKDGYLQQPSGFIQNDNCDYLKKFISYHYDKAISVGATSVELISGSIFYCFGNTALKETSIPVGISGLKYIHVASKILTLEMKSNLIELSKAVLSSSRTIVLITGSQLDLRSEFLRKTLALQGANSIVRDAQSGVEFFDDLPASGYLIVKTPLKSFADVLASYVKGDKSKADRLAHSFAASSGQVDLPAVCQSCGIQHDNASVTVSERGFTLPAGNGISRNPVGCNDCFKGYIGVANACELQHSGSQKLINAISAVGVEELNKSEVSVVHTKFTSDGLRTVYNDAGKLVVDGCVSFDDAKRNLL